MTATSTTTAAAPAPNAQTSSAAAAAPATKPSLDDFLREFDSAAAPARPAVAAAPAAAAPSGAAAAAAAPAAPAIDPDRIARLERVASRVEAQDTETEINRVVDSIRGSSEFLKSVDQTVIYGYLQGLGARDVRFRNAFMQRTAKPEVWANILTTVGAQLEEKLKPVAAAPSATARASVIAAARVSGSAPVTPKVDTAAVAAMSDAQFAAHKRRVLAAGR